MELSEFPLNLERCRKSFEYWKSIFKHDGDLSKEAEVVLSAQCLPTTHTFPSVRVWKVPNLDDGISVPKDRGYCYPYINIFFEDEALLSDGRREQLGRFGRFEPRRDMSRVREVGLNWFVFAAMGSHDPYYGGLGERAFKVKPFGVFVTTENELFPQVHASRRDISEKNPEVQIEEIENVFDYCMTAKQARELLPLEILTDERFRRDFYEYWGKPEHWNDITKIESHWQWKYEMRFFGQVNVNQIDAVLWPSYAKTNMTVNSLEINDIDEIQRFKDMYPKIRIIDYPWEQDDNGMGLVRASHLSAKFYVSNKRFPESWLELESEVVE